ncbi:ninein homolog isoform X1 [Neodiprion pinetum]|uniref:ninein homolog isoform X1 n=1 Tax=Neodiprion pinetum TaxID=441929 RepID=UPI001EDED388|nr:blastoderm-specific protein 25D isoform X1 [Neodiprion pinetum]XP_046466246.1 blastoderm-specific protein 25D isoform X1 [Neodiprion pinetum]XP_046466248.1 blastoderm-specific protein 25D isoform X1 [Neodiprion pinetum]XP_046466249.1 blastoderm-specific protein 25D isoform X1 [Neodiprion pinetum]
MEGNCTDPYEQQLLAVFESCQTKGQTRLNENGLRLLCEKLQLEEQGKELISCLLEQTETDKSVSFYEFRDGLLALLGNAQDGISSYSDREFSNGDSLQSLNSTKLANKRYGRKSKPKDQNADIVDFQHQHLDGARNEMWRGVDGLLNQDIKIDEQRLREIWAKINLGLDRQEMPIVSQYIGIPLLPKQTLEQIFEKLDMDHDGQITLEEFLLIFSNPKMLHEQLSSGWNAGFRNDIMKQDSEKESIQIRGPHHTGYARSSTVVDMWEVAGVPDAATFLSELGFTSPDISLTELTNVLCEELKSLRDESDNRVMGTHISLLKGALVLYQEEVRSLNTLVEHLSGERDKLRGDIAEANQRATLLAQEVDEHHICLEKSSQNQIKQLELKNAEILKDLTDQLTSERESNAATLRLMDQRLQTLQQEDQRIRTELANVLSENHTLETENQNLSEHLSKLRSSNNQLQMQIQTLVAEHDEVENVEVKENEVLVSLLVRIKKLQSDNAALRDQNDELTSELEVMKHSESDVQSSGNLDIIDSKDLTARVAELEALLASKTIRNKDISIGSNNLNAVIETQEQQLVELRSVLEKLKKELVNVVTEKKNNCTLDNCLLKNRMLDVICRIDTNLSPHPQETDSIKSLANELEAESAQLTNECSRDFVTNRTDKGKVDRKALGNDDIVKNTDKNFNNLDMKTMSKNKMTGLRDYPPRRDENGSDQSKIDREKSNVFYNVRQSSEKAENSKDCTDFDKVTDILPEVEEKYVNEKKQLSERCTELERSLDLLRTEYEQCEDYWAGKLEEERQLFEQEQRISDEKFSELIAKMAEYEEQFGNSDKTHNDGRLSPIEERFNLEQQYTNLEEEFSEWKSEMQKELTKKDQEIHDLREKLQRGNRILTVETSVQCPEESASHSHSTTGMSEVVVHGKNLSSSKITSYDTDSHVLNDSLKLKRLTESESPYAEVCTSRPASILPCLHGCSCYQIQSYSVAEGMCRAHRDELRRLHQLKINLDTECSNLIKQKEVLMQEILKLQSLRAISCSCTKTITGEQACRIDLNVLQALNARLQSQEQKCHHLQVSLKQQQQYTDRILHQTWKQHRNEIADLQFLLCGTQEKLQQHLQAYKEQAENLARADMLAKDLYLENSYLMASVERLEQHCHVLTQYSTESTSV